VAAKSVTAERDELVQEQLRGITSTLDRLERHLATVTSDLGAVRLGEMSEITARMAKLEGDVQLLRYQMGRSGAMWGLIVTPIAAAIVSGVMALLLHH
jgi:polyhydroxyalkanoate synthesis regulator phasin